MQSKGKLMQRLRDERAAEAEKHGLVKLRIELYVTPLQRQEALDLAATFQHELPAAVNKACNAPRGRQYG